MGAISSEVPPDEYGAAKRIGLAGYCSCPFAAPFALAPEAGSPNKEQHNDATCSEHRRTLREPIGRRTDSAHIPWFKTLF